MYRAGDSVQHWKAGFYFTTMIFFLAWMVKNVFIAVITETFNEIRVQFQEMWGDRHKIEGETITQVRIFELVSLVLFDFDLIFQVLQGDKRSWQLITVHENRHSGCAPAFCHQILQSPFYHVTVMIITITNAIVMASISFK